MNKYIYLTHVKFGISVVFAGLIGGCASVNQNYSLKETTTLIPESISVRPAGRNWKITGLAVNEKTRFQLETFATNCQDSTGSLFIETPNSTISDMVKVVSGTRTLPDKFFTALCAVGLPLAEAEDDARSARSPSRALSPQERAVILQNILRNTVPSKSQEIETRCERVPNSRTSEVVCVQK